MEYMKNGGRIWERVEGGEERYVANGVRMRVGCADEVVRRSKGLE